jgi:phenylpropionate dioxygenase-like ring-hydroxylating dioxygenase large terminal subunit
MGEALRRYWMPALMADELPEPDCPPVKVGLLGEKLVAFRDSQGRLGLLEEGCPHRGTSLFLGRNEENGLRCIFHGWKFDVAGNCLDMMNEPEGSDYKNKIKTTSYPVVEMGDVIWAYLGPPDKQPPPPKFEWTQVPATHRLVTKNRQDCNWLQGLEGGIDTAHAPILHRRISKDTQRPGFSVDIAFVTGKPPQVEVDRTDYGYRYAGIRTLGDEGKNFVRAYHYVMPSTKSAPHSSGCTARRLGPSSPAMPGCRWMTTTRWSTTGCTATVKSPCLRKTGTLSGSSGGDPASLTTTTGRFATGRMIG